MQTHWSTDPYVHIFYPQAELIVNVTEVQSSLSHLSQHVYIFLEQGQKA